MKWMRQSPEPVPRSPRGAGSLPACARSATAGARGQGRGAPRGAGAARGSQRRQAARLGARRDGHGRGHVPLLRRGARATDGRHDPGGRRAGVHGPRAAGCGGTDRAVEFPADDRRLEARAGTGGRQHGCAQAGRAHAADGPALRAAGAGGRDRAGRGERRRREGHGGRSTARRASRRGQDRLHRVDGGRAHDRRQRGADDQACDARARRQIGQHHLRRRGSGEGRGSSPVGGL